MSSTACETESPLWGAECTHTTVNVAPKWAARARVGLTADRGLGTCVWAAENDSGAAICVERTELFRFTGPSLVAIFMFRVACDEVLHFVEISFAIVRNFPRGR